MEKTKEQILIVDDTQQVRAFVFDCLASDYDCTVASSAENAINLLRAHFFHLVITDVNMPGMSGIELCEFIRNNHRKTAVIIMSGTPASLRGQYEFGSKQLGASGFLAKPFRPAELMTMVQAAIA